ncbi:MAG: IclR family transcriptional regulator [Desulfobacteraceae bacterium]|jgi:IclR family KDG regulon transcriptional repressor
MGVAGEMKAAFKRVPALDKGFSILEFLAASKKPLGISDISNALGYHKSTVFNMVYTLTHLGILEHGPDNKFRFGLKLYVLGKAAGEASAWIQAVRPYLEDLNAKTKLSVFLGIRSGLRAVIVDKIDSPSDIKVSSETGMRIPLLAGAGGKVLLSQLSEAEMDEILSENKLNKFTPFSCVNKRKYKEIIKKARQEGFAFDDEEYIEGIRALAVPLRLNRGHLEAAIWVIGLKSQIKDEMIGLYSSMLKESAEKIEARFSIE